MVERFSNPRWVFRAGIALLIALGLLGLLGYHLLSFDYVDPESREEIGKSVRPELRVEAISSAYDGSPGVYAVFTLFNSSNKRLRLLDTLEQSPLYSVKLRYEEKGGLMQDVAMSRESLAAQRNAALKPASSGFNPEVNTVVRLLPRSALTRTLILTGDFDLSRKGKYHLTVSYQPGALAESGGFDLKELNVFGERRTASASFEIPLNPELPAGVKPEEEKPAVEKKAAEKKSAPPSAEGAKLPAQREAGSGKK